MVTRSSHLVAAFAAVSAAAVFASFCPTAHATVTGLTGAAFSFDAGSTTTPAGFSGTGALGEAIVPLTNGNGTPPTTAYTLGDGISLLISDASGFNGTGTNATAAAGTIYENYAFSPGTATLTFEGLTPNTNYEVAGYDFQNDTFSIGSSSASTNGPGGGFGTTGYTAYTLGTNYVTLMGTSDASGNLAVSVGVGTGQSDLRVSGIGIASVTTPEPAAAVLLAVGTVGALALMRRRHA